MSASFLLVLGAVGILLLLLAWALGTPGRRVSPLKTDPSLLEQAERRHATYLPVINQSLSPGDFDFLAARGSARLANRAHKERQRITLTYLLELRGDFERLLRLARVIAVLSPEVGAAQELERLRLSFQFSWRYHLVRWALRSGLLGTRQLNGLSLVVSELAVRMEAALKELGERAALASELASTLDRRGLDVA
jgi:hypothetical protein